MAARTTTISWDGDLSDAFILKQGTKQGAQLSTTLYKVYHNHLLNTNGDSAIRVPTPTCADDTATLANTQEELQAVLDIVEYNTKRKPVKINPDKSELLTLECKQPKEVTLACAPIATVTSVKHLGIDRTAKNTVDSDRTVYAALGPGLHARKGLSPEVSFHVWKIYVILRFLYGIEVQVLSSTNLRKLQAFQRKVLRHLQGSPERSSNAAVYTLLVIETRIS
ncbi:hypothetical protein DPMN_156780 [Dreissena polymorpha]|uniref:Reverse transcriptase domain-containing protein n=1 Tax=Dreissena polymorpha TaxID=45954 RepID=A0A9D4FQG2_DREPO|nr:hypothetical protein DPMN_156780 [Dreissena polymorpha]